MKTRAREGAGILNVGRVALPPALLTVVTITDLGDAMAVEERRAYLTKARESLASAEVDYAAARYNSCANRAYYACFQAAVAALLAEGLRPANPRGEWSHEFVQSQFNGLLIGRRKRYPSTLRRILRDTIEVREKADYTPAAVSARVAERVLHAAQSFVRALEEHKQ